MSSVDATRGDGRDARLTVLRKNNEEVYFICFPHCLHPSSTISSLMLFLTLLFTQHLFQHLFLSSSFSLFLSLQVLRKQLINEAKETCKDYAVAFGKCALDASIMVVFKCREQNKAMSDCYAREYTEEIFEKVIFFSHMIWNKTHFYYFITSHNVLYSTRLIEGSWLLKWRKKWMHKKYDIQ